MRPRRPTLPALLVTLLLAPAAGAVQDPGQESFPPAEREPQASAEEIAARDAFHVAQAEVPGPEDRTPEAFDAYLDRLTAALSAFAEAHAGTAAAYEARHELALMDIHARNRVEAGLARMEAILKDSRAWKGPAPDGLRLDVRNYDFVFALALADLGRFARAEELLEAASNEKGTRGEQAQRLLQRVRIRKRLQVGKPMPAFAGPRLEGAGVWQLSDFAGQPLLIQFWASWSPPSTQELRQVATLAEEYGPRGLRVLTVSLDDARREGRINAQTYLEQIGLKAPTIYDGKGWQNAVVQAFAVRAIPANFLLDAEGIIRAADLRGPDLRAALDAMLTPPEEPDDEEPSSSDGG